MTEYAGWTQKEAEGFDFFLQEACGIPAGILMENAGKASAEIALNLSIENGYSNILFLVGPGNNGGDALVSARHLFSALPIQVWAPIGPPKDPNSPAYSAWDALQRMNVPLSERGGSPIELTPATLVLDGLFGIGLSRPVEGAAAEALQMIYQSPAKVLALDIPSGLDTDTGCIHGKALPAHWTLSFVGPKRGFFLQDGPLLCGQIQTAPIGVSSAFAEAWLENRRVASLES